MVFRNNEVSRMVEGQWEREGGEAGVGVGVRVVTSLRAGNMSLASYKTYIKLIYILKYRSKDVFKVHFPSQNDQENSFYMLTTFETYNTR